MLDEINLILNDRESGSVALLKRLLDTLEVELQDGSVKIAAHFLEHFNPEGKTILTHSHSHTVISLLDQLHLKQIPFKVLQTLSHPGEEGKKSYERMCELKLQTVLIEDGNVKEALAHTDLILLGCDALLDKKFLNKTGTRTILEEAKHFKTPSFLVTESRKEITDSDWERELKDLSLFEWVPLNLLDRIVTEK